MSHRVTTFITFITVTLSTVTNIFCHQCVLMISEAVLIHNMVHMDDKRDTVEIGWSETGLVD